MCPSAVEWINKVWYIHIMKYFKEVKMNEVLPHTATWMHLTDIILTKRSQAHKTEV